MIKVIVSHDVDHLYGRDHWFRDLIYPKMWVRTTLELFRGQITGHEWWLRNTSCFRKYRHNLQAQMDFDREHGIESVFFFGMAKGLGMSYKPAEAKPMISLVHDNGFDTGVHGIDYQSQDGINKEYNTFKELMGYDPCGIRMHYVRFDEETFGRLNVAGYVFDTTEFDKPSCGTLKAPYMVGDMWEFPLAIMDGYLPQQFEKAKEKTLEILDRCRGMGLTYVTVLFHDYQFCDDYKDIRDWYVWLMDYIKDSPDYEFISYRKAIAELGGTL
ncbi:MAG: hypothetical protein K6A80_11565 [Saccharofermentans sp.]|nr:hypothetical protein [Saccharofermentans sp.]